MDEAARQLVRALATPLGYTDRRLADLHADVVRSLPRKSASTVAWEYLARSFAVLDMARKARLQHKAEFELEQRDDLAAEVRKRRAVRELRAGRPEFAELMAKHPLGLVGFVTRAGDVLTPGDFRSPPAARAAGRHNETALRDFVIRMLVDYHPIRRGPARWMLAVRLAFPGQTVDAEHVRRDLRRRARDPAREPELDWLLANWASLLREVFAEADARSRV